LEGGLGVTRNRDQAIEWYRKAAAAGNEPAKAALKSLGVKD
jgi:TPR repeat protein